MKSRTESKNNLLFSLTQWLDIGWDKYKQLENQQFLVCIPLRKKQELGFTAFGRCLTKLIYFPDLHMIQKSVHMPSMAFIPSITDPNKNVHFRESYNKSDLLGIQQV